MLHHLFTLRAAGVPISLREVVGMWQRRSLSEELVRAITFAHREGLDVPLRDLESLHLAGGKPYDVVLAAAVIKLRGYEPDFQHLSALQLMGRDLRAAGHAFGEAANTHPELEAREFFMRLASGEDVVAQVYGGSFRPLAKLGNWILRIDSPPMTGEAMLGLLESGQVPEQARIQAPNDLAWLTREQALHRLRRQGPGAA